MAIDLVTRKEWGARAPRGSYSTVRSTRGVKVHYTGGRVDPRLAEDHDRCVAAVKAVQNMHMDGNGWLDIAYSMVACPHRKVFVGRGPGHLTAANGPGLNTGHYSVLGLVGNSGLVVPSDGMLHGILDAIEYLRDEGGAGREIKGHRDGYATDCPGGQLYSWVRKGAPRPGANSTPAKSKPEPAPKPIEIVWEGDVPRWPGRVLTYTKGKPYMQGEDVRVWQAKLQKRGWSIDVDGLFGEESTAVCRNYQQATGLMKSGSGQVDEDTWNMSWSWRPPTPAKS
ncbi:N-acetylmuramoyl-L-alanine amidase [Sphaerisporangium album]|uniref:N-acetylmuramoyl-L-alanine amidase n=1 Tax=Sphaerisporangium album TaxID=509200 RepID=A0A367FP38_9ACTN|nr:N-acetylmuramoyl-L-alanine amidase [Sphaerisporangium album]RCG32004.1 N-acetylmuramoyl-L-alanine amidase [Sphaerisporangium album]